MNVCPCCKRKMPVLKSVEDKRFVQDKAKVKAAIRACENALTNPWFADALEAITDEMARLYRMLGGDYKLMWAVYRRADKGVPYYQQKPALKKAA